jgi:hypothetical protein
MIVEEFNPDGLAASFRHAADSGFPAVKPGRKPEMNGQVKVETEI